MPIRFEDEYPEEAETLMKLCSDKEFRQLTQWQESKLPRSERTYPNINDLELGMLGWKYMPFGTTKKDIPYKRTEPKVNRNATCPCGSGKKFKKCCLIKKEVLCYPPNNA